MRCHTSYNELQSFCLPKISAASGLATFHTKSNHGRRKDFSREGTLADFSRGSLNDFSRVGAKSGAISFFFLGTKKTTIFAKM